MMEIKSVKEKPNEKLTMDQRNKTMLIHTFWSFDKIFKTWIESYKTTHCSPNCNSLMVSKLLHL